MFGGLKRTLVTQWAVRKDFIFLAACGYFAFSTDHLWFKKARYALWKTGIYHRNLKLTASP